MITKFPHTDGEHKACAKAPDAIIKALETIYSNSRGYSISVPETNTATLENIPDSKIYLGGDHTITYHTFKQFTKTYKNAGLVIFDAHPDVFQQFDKPTHVDFLKFLVEEYIVKPSNVFVIGLRNCHPSEIKYYKDRGINYSFCNTFNTDSFDGIMAKLRTLDAFYVSIDLDVLDPAYAPGVSYLEPAGLTTKQLLFSLHRLKNLPNLKAIDIVELNPEKDINGMTAKVAAKIVAEFL